MKVVVKQSKSKGSKVALVKVAAKAPQKFKQPMVCN